MKMYKEEFKEQHENRVEHEQADAYLPPRRLPFISVIFDYLYLLKHLIISIVIGAAFIFTKWPVIGWLVFLLLMIVILIVLIISWSRFTYRVENNELRIDQGIFIRKKRHIAMNRIHKIDLTANVLHRILKLTQVQIDTASSGDGANVMLSAVKLDQAIVLRQALQNKRDNHRQAKEKTVDKEENPKRKVSWKNLIIAGSTSSSIGLVVLLAVSGMSQIAEIIPDSIYDQAFSFVMGLSIIIIGLLILFLIFLIWVVGIFSTLIKYGHFTIEKREKELFIKRGLLETKELTIPFERIQAVQIEQTLIRQPLKYVRVYAIVVGGSGDMGEANPVLFPLMKVNELAAFLAAFLPMYQAETLLPEVNIAKKGKKYYLFKLTLPFLLLTIGIGIFFTKWIWLPAILFALSLILALWQWKDSGYRIKDNQLILQKRIFNKNTTMVFKRKIQSCQQVQHVLQRKSKIATLSFATLGMEDYRLVHLEETDVEKIMYWYSYRKDKM